MDPFWRALITGEELPPRSPPTDEEIAEAFGELADAYRLDDRQDTETDIE